MDKASIDRAIAHELDARGLKKKSICGLDSAFVLDFDVCPYFLPRVLRKSSTLYVIDGVVGLVDKKFERVWLENNKPQSNKNKFCFVLNIANVPDLLSVQHISEAAYEDSVVRFCRAVSDFLSAMPRDEASLAEGFRVGELCGIPIHKFSGYAFRAKFEELKIFVTGISGT